MNRFLNKKVDRTFALIVVILTCAGFVIFSSASLGLLARNGASFSKVALSQLFFGIGLGSLAAYGLSRVQYRLWRKWSLPILILSIVATLLVFLPYIGAEYGGAKRWIHIAGISFQPAELLKIGVVIYFAAWLSSVRERVAEFRYGLLPLFVLLAISGTILLLQPDTDTFIIIAIASLAMYVSAGGSMKHVLLIGCIGLIGIMFLATMRPYIKSRLMTFLNPAADPLGAGYQIQQSLIAIGSGGFSGRGFGQSIQKFQYLPEPIGDSIFAVEAEEFGFIGSMTLIGIFLVFMLRGLRIATHAPDKFGGLLAIGIVILIIANSFLNIAAMLGIIPLSGLPLLFVSHGGTAMLITLAEVGILLNISRYQKN